MKKESTFTGKEKVVYEFNKYEIYEALKEKYHIDTKYNNVEFEIYQDEYDFNNEEITRPAVAVLTVEYDIKNYRSK